MSDFWPDDLELEDNRSPWEILEEAHADWEEHSGGRLNLVLQATESVSGNDMIVVHAKFEPSGRTAELFTVVHRPGSPYPARIQPKDDLPDVFKKSYRVANKTMGALAMTIGAERDVVNEWVADTPAEFRSKLREVLNLGSTKSEIVSLAATRPPDAGKADAGKADAGKADAGKADAGKADAGTVGAAAAATP